MSKRIFWIALFVTLVSVALLISVFLIKNYSKNQARSVCGYSISEIKTQCMNERFAGKDLKNGILGYLDDADFEAAGRSQVRGVRYDFFHKSEYYEKGPREILLIVGVKSGLVETVTTKKWVTANWELGGGPASPFSQCLEISDSCKEFVSE